MTDNEKLARWQGWKPDEFTVLKYSLAWVSPDGITKHAIYPNYTVDEVAARSLLDTLIAKGFAIEICSNDSTWACEIIGYARVYKPTRRESVVAAVLQLLQGE